MAKYGEDVQMNNTIVSPKPIHLVQIGDKLSSFDRKTEEYSMLVLE